MLGTNEMPLTIVSAAEKRYNGRIAVGLGPLHNERLKKIPGTTYWRKGSCWTLPLAWTSVLMLGSLAKEIKHQIRPSKELAAWVVQAKQEWAELAARSSVLSIESDEPDGLFAHQRADIEWLAYDGATRGRLLLNEMGTGKTRSVIMTLAALKLAGAFPALVVCPKIVSHRGWSDEWATADPDVRVMVAEGTLPNRRKAIKAVANGEADVLVIGYESMRGHTRYEGYGSIALKRCPSCHGPTIETATEDSPLIPESKCQAHPKELNQIEWKAIILDEAHRALNASSQTRMALSGVVNYTGPDTRRWLITGTPVSKDPDGIWSLLHIADPECWPVRGTWVNRYCEKGFNSGGFEVVIGYDTTYETEFRKSFDAISRRVLKEMVLDLPDILRGTTLVHEVEMGTEQRKLYEAMRDEMIVQLKEGTLLAANAAVQVGRLTLLASAAGFPGDTPGEMLLRAPSCKIDELVEMIKNKELPDSWCAAFTSRRMLRLTVAELVKKGLFEEWQIGIIDGGATDADRNLAVKRFQGGDIPVVFYTHAAGGIGITLHRAETLVLVERHWSNNIMLQSLARVHRAGMPDRPVSVVDIITRNTVEERQLNRLQQDADLLEWVVQDQQRLEEFLRHGDVVEAVPALT